MKRFYITKKNKLLQTINKNYSNAVLSLLIFIGVGTTAFFYFYNYGYIYWLAFLALPVLFLLLFLFIFIGLKNTFNVNYWHLAIGRLFNNTKLSIGLAGILLSAFFVSIIIANIFLFDFVICKRISANSAADFLFYEANIWLRISSLFLFYAVFIILFWSLGTKIMALIKIRLKDNLESFLLAIGFGLIPLAFVTYLIALLGFLHSYVIWALVITFILISRNEIIKILKSFNSKIITFSFKNPFQTFKNIVLSGLFVLLCFSFVINIKPVPITTDDLHTYYNAPALYVSYHKYKPLFHHETANMGQNTEIIYAAIMSVLDAKYIVHFQLIFFILTCAGIYLLLKNFFGENYALWGLLFIYFIPWNPYYLSTTKVEFFLSFYLMLLLFVLWKWHREQKTSWLYLFGALAGISIGIKYSALFLILPLGLLALILMVIKKTKLKILLKNIIMTALLALVFFSPWAIKNCYYFDNIFYPREFLGFTNSNPVESLEYDNNYFYARNKEVRFLRHGQLDKTSSISIANTLWRQSTGYKIDRGAWINFGFLPLIIIPFFLLLYRDKKIMVIISVIILYFSLWFVADGARPWYAFFGIMLIYGLSPLLLKKYRRLFFAIPILIIFTSIINIFVLTPNLKYLFGNFNSEQYIARTVVYYGLAQYINKQLDLLPGEKILIVKDFRTAFINKNDKIIFADQYLTKISYALNQGEEYFKDYLKRNSITYIMDSKRNENQFNGWLEKHSLSKEQYLLNYSGTAPSIYEDFKTLNKFLQTNAVIIYNDNDYSLYKINQP